MEFIFKPKEEYENHVKLMGTEPKNYNILNDYLQTPTEEEAEKNLTSFGRRTNNK